MADIPNLLESLVLSPPADTRSPTHTVDIDLPTELVAKILEIAAASSTQTAATLCRVAQWVCDLAAPHLHTICGVGIASDKWALPEFAAKMAAGESLQTDIIMESPELGRSVHALWNHYNGFQLIEFMAVCPNVQYIAFADIPILVAAVSPYAKFHLTPEFLAKTHDIHITLFAERGLLNVSKYLGTPGTAEFIGRISHLCMMDFRPNSFPALSTFSGLTHFALPHLGVSWFIALLQLAVGWMKKLVCIVVIVDPSVHASTVVQSATDELLKLHKSSPKFLLFQAEIATTNKDADLDANREKLREMWELEVRGGESLWDKARKYTHTLMTP